jgi:hypothetical protein
MALQDEQGLWGAAAVLLCVGMGQTSCSIAIKG